MPVFKALKKHKLLLDTHVWIWLMLGDERLDRSFRRLVEDYKDKDLLHISAISVLELGMLVERKKIELEIDGLDWVEQSLTSISLIPLSPQIAFESSRLPGKPHGDPADRILIATARENHAILVTHDQKILEYGHGDFIGVYDPVSKK